MHLWMRNKEENEWFKSMLDYEEEGDVGPFAHLADFWFHVGDVPHDLPQNFRVEGEEGIATQHNEFRDPRSGGETIQPLF